jgi:para-aminobenzoate synthetase/4-amino-4-deoxychorismate lyase
LAPERAARLVRGDAHPFALIGRWAGGGALIGSEPIRVLAPGEDPFALLDSQPHVDGDDPRAVGGGWFGYLGYELGRSVEPVGASPPAGAAGGLPPARLAFYDNVLRLDADGRWWFEALCSAAREAALGGRLRVLRARAASGAGAPGPFATEPWRSTPGSAGHELAVEACRQRIYAGDLFQANVCVRLGSRLHGSPLDLFAAGVASLRPDRAAFLAGPWGAVASLSPELFLERHGRRVRSAPIKGTQRLDSRDELVASSKDRAENVMIVDLVRNDLGRVCRPGSVQVDVLAAAREHTGVWHLVSEVSGTLAAGVGDAQLVRAAFPPGSVTGAPKVAALNVIAELESTARQVYTGAIGFASPVAGLELSVAIRTFEFDQQRAWLGVGGGIVADSDPRGEAVECATKARPLLAAIGGELAPADRRPSGAPIPLRVSPRPVPRPEPAAGVFETLLLAGGRPVALERHLARLARSVRTLYGRSLPDELDASLRKRAASEDAARMRVDVLPRSRGVDVEVTVTALSPRTVPVELVVQTLPGGLGEHKWIDRRLLDALSRDGEPLLCDLDGLVLETARANVFAVDRGGRLLTPPADGRILPGVMRAMVLERAVALGLEIEVGPLPLNELAAASEVFVTGSLGGVEPAALHGRPARDGRVTARLAQATARVVAAPSTSTTHAGSKPATG